MKLIRTLYFVSSNSDLKSLVPRVPVNYMTMNKIEDWKTKRISVCPTISQCLRGMSSNLKGQILTVYKLLNPKSSLIYQPSAKEVPDVEVTGELWYLDFTRLVKVSTIQVTRATNKSYQYNYKTPDGIVHSAELFDWNFRII